MTQERYISEKSTLLIKNRMIQLQRDIVFTQSRASFSLIFIRKAHGMAYYSYL